MDRFLESALPFGVIALLWICLTIRHAVKQVSQRIDAIEVDRAWFTKRRDEQIESLQSEVYELKSLVRDLVDFQKGDGRYRYDPDDPRLPAHLRDQTGRDY
ncbi:hypothetical protein [Pseudomonas sp. TNT2022 ID642]|uniref:hypothetical protein n=1 Tax=Pseudomonas sp. TNT2022 ID642 TaxID=2942632 RepID=UPI00235E0C12|nr:hypothetical protein [Pseudomonas sp. TNT2022 ID642]MDD1002390.1 hypothetical protein [Pseudomonas sp. TNT2022 ID642]